MIANHLGDGVNIDIRAPQQLLCFVDTDLVDMVSQRYTGSFFKGPAQVGGGNMQSIRNLL